MSPRETYGTFSTAYVEAMRLRLSALEPENKGLSARVAELEVDNKTLRDRFSDADTERNAAQAALKAAFARVAELDARCKRLEDAGDAMAEWNMSERNLGCDPELADKWQQAKEARPCPHCLRVECECSEFDAVPDIGDK